MNNQQIKEQEIYVNIEERAKYLQKLQFCIVSTCKSQMCRDRLVIFALERHSV